MIWILDRSWVEDRSRMLGEEVVDDIFESVSIDSTEPIHDRFVVVRRLVSVFDHVVNRGGACGSFRRFSTEWACV